MKFFIVALAFVGVCVHADVSELGYKYHEAAPASAALPVEPERSYVPAPAPINSYVPPVQPQPAPAPNNHLATNNYLAPESPAPHAVEPASAYIPPQLVAAPQPISPLEEIEQTPEDGYHYKTVRQVVYRHRF